MFYFLALVTSFLKQDLLGCKNVLEFERKMRERALKIDDYDYFTMIFNSFRDQDHSGSFNFRPAESIYHHFPALESVVQDRLRERSIEDAKARQKQKDEEEARRKQFDMITANNMLVDPI